MNLRATARISAWPGSGRSRISSLTTSTGPLTRWATFYEWRSHFQEGEAAFHLAAEQLSETESEVGLRLLAKALLWQAAFNRLLGRFDLAQQLARQSLNLLERPVLIDGDSRAEKAAILLELGQQAQTANRDEARSWCEESLSLFRALDDQWGMARAMHLLGDHYHVGGKPSEGIQLLEASLQLYQALGDQRGIAGVLGAQGFQAIMQGQAERGEKMLRQSLAIYREMDDRVAIVNCLRPLGYGSGNQGRYTEAHAIGEEAMRISQTLGNRRLVAGSSALLATTNSNLGRYDQARSYGQMTLRLRREIGFPSGISFGLWMLGHVALAKGDYVGAEPLLRESVTIHRKTGEEGRLREVLISLGYAVLGAGKVAQARTCLAEALRKTIDVRYTRSGINAIALAARILGEQGEVEKAVEQYALASRYPVVANSKWYEDVVGKHIAAAAQALPSEVVASRKRAWGSKRFVADGKRIAGRTGRWVIQLPAHRFVFPLVRSQLPSQPVQLRPFAAGQTSVDIIQHGGDIPNAFNYIMRPGVDHFQVSLVQSGLKDVGIESVGFSFVQANLIARFGQADGPHAGVQALGDAGQRVIHLDDGLHRIDAQLLGIEERHPGGRPPGWHLAGGYGGVRFIAPCVGLNQQ